MICPRRIEVRALPPDTEDEWKTQFWPFPNCSFCGSREPQELIEEIRSGKVVIGPTDKNYKVYVRIIGDASGRDGKFYFQHFTKEQQNEFIELHNNKTMQISYPGYFYVLPYFTVENPEGVKNESS